MSEGDNITLRSVLPPVGPEKPPVDRSKLFHGLTTIAAGQREYGSSLFEEILRVVENPSTTKVKASFRQPLIDLGIFQGGDAGKLKQGGRMPHALADEIERMLIVDPSKGIRVRTEEELSEPLPPKEDIRG